MRIFHLFLCAIALLLYVSTGRAVPAPPTGLTALHHDGQSFLTWLEVPGDQTRYSVYCATSPIVSVAGLSPLGNVDQNSSRDRRGQTAEGSGALYFSIIPNTPLPANRGLLVHTTLVNGEFYYAVTSYDNTGENTAITPGSNSLVAAVNETTAIPVPVLQRTITIGSQQVEIYVHWVSDFDAPFYPSMANIPSLPFHFGLSRRGSGSSHPLLFRPHARGGSYVNVTGGTGNSEEWTVALDDDIQDTVRNTHWFGYHEDLARGAGFPTAPDTGMVMDYTARRMDWTLEWALRTLPVDSNRVYMYGGSMGAIGSIFYSLRHPERIAAIHGTVPKFDYSFTSDPNPANTFNPGGYERRVADRLWGPVVVNLPSSAGYPIYEQLNAGTMIKRIMNQDMPPMMVFNGKQDVVVGWAEKIHTYQDWDSARQAAVFFFDQRGHGSSGGAQAWQPEQAVGQWLYQFRLDQSFPAFSRCSVNDDPGDGNMTSGDSIGTINGHLAFSTVVDSAEYWEVTITRRNLNSLWGVVPAPESITADVTPRRLQRFDLLSQQIYFWRNTQLPENAVVQSGCTALDEYGLLTVADFLVTGAGNILRIELEPAPEPTAVTISTDGSQVTLRWQPSPCAGSYQIYSSTNADFTTETLLGETTGTEFTTTVTSDRHYYRVVTVSQ